MTVSSTARRITAALVVAFLVSRSSTPELRLVFHGYTARAQASAGADNQAPDFTLPSLAGHSVRLHDLLGKVVLVNFWATWCAPCKVETPWLVDVYQRYRSEGLEIVGVSMDDGGRDAVAKFAKAYRIDYAILFGNAAVADAYGGVRFLPQTFLLNRDGTIAKRMFGIQQKASLEADVQAALGKQRLEPGAVPPATTLPPKSAAGGVGCTVEMPKSRRRSPKQSVKSAGFSTADPRSTPGRRQRAFI